MMFDEELPEHAKLALEAARKDFLGNMRGRSDTYDGIRRAADRFMKATSAPDGVRPLVEGLLILQLKELRAEAARDRRSEVEAAKRGERTRIRLAVADVLKD